MREQPVGEPVPWADLLTQWNLIEWDFHHTLHVDLPTVIRGRSWRWFRVRVGGLLATPGTALHTHFADDNTEPEGAPDGGFGGDDYRVD